MKTDIEKKLDEALDRYFEKFNTPYPMFFTSQKTENEVIAEIEKAIKTGKKCKPPEIDLEDDY